MPFGVIRFKKLHASCTSVVVTNARSFLTHPISAVAQADRHERIEDQREQRPAPRRVLELGLDRLPIDPLEAGDPDPDREQHADEHPDVDPRETLDLERGHVLDPGGRREVGSHLLQGLAEMLAPLGRSPGQRRRLHVRDDRSEPFRSQGRERRRDRAIVTDELRADDEQRSRCRAAASTARCPRTRHRGRRTRPRRRRRRGESRRAHRARRPRRAASRAAPTPRPGRNPSRHHRDPRA